MKMALPHISCTILPSWTASKVVQAEVSPQRHRHLQLRYVGPAIIVLAAFAIVVSVLLTLSLADGSILTRRLSDGLEWAARHTLGRVGITSPADGPDEQPLVIGATGVIVDAYAGVRVRETPSEAGRTLGAIIAGDTVRVLAEPQMVNGEMWVRVSWQQGELEGWIPVRFVKIDSR